MAIRATAGPYPGGVGTGGRWSDLERPPLAAAALRAALTEGPGAGWRALELVDSTASTNADLAARALAGEAPGLVLVADHQSAGRGRLGRDWQAPPRAGLAVSVLLHPTAPRETWSWLPLLAGVAAVDAFVHGCGLPARLKWPNDVLVPEGGLAAGRPLKVCGILAEVVSGPDGPVVVLGAGINVSQDPGELPVPTATSLRLAGSATTDRSTVLRAYLRALARRYRAWSDGGGGPRAGGTAAAYREACATIGLRVQVQLPSAPALDGVAEGVDDAGRLLVRDDAGQLHPLAAGDVTHVHPATAPAGG